MNWNNLIDCWHFWLELMEVGILTVMLIAVLILARKTKKNDEEIKKHHGNSSKLSK